jgi:hypothetical protein
MRITGGPDGVVSVDVTSRTASRIPGSLATVKSLLVNVTVPAAIEAVQAKAKARALSIPIRFITRSAYNSIQQIPAD